MQSVEMFSIKSVFLVWKIMNGSDGGADSSRHDSPTFAAYHHVVRWMRNRRWRLPGNKPVSDDQKKKSKEEEEAEAELQRESLVGRKFTIAEAIGRLAGPGMMKGVSPITGKEQADVKIQEYLRFHLTDSAGALSTVLLRHVKESQALLAGFEQPLVVLAEYIQRILATDFRLKEFVREVDAEWGRSFGERPFFDKEGCPPDPDDPYTLESVRTALTQLFERLNQQEV